MKSSAIKSVEKNDHGTNKNAESQNDALNKLVAGGMSLKDIEFLGSLAKNMRQEEEPEYAETIRGRCIDVPRRKSPLFPARDTKHPRSTRSKIKSNALDDAENSENYEINVPSTEIPGTKPKNKIENLTAAKNSEKNKDDTHQNIEDSNGKVKSYDVDKDKLFEWAKSRGKLENGKFPEPPRLGRLVTFYKNSIRLQGDAQNDKEMDPRNDSESQKDVSFYNSIHKNDKLYEDFDDSDNLSDIEDQMLTMYLLVKRGLRKFKSIEQRLQSYFEKSRRK